MTEEFIKGLSTEQLLRHVVILINEYIALDKSSDNTEVIDKRRSQLIMFTKEIGVRNSQAEQFEFG